MAWAKKKLGRRGRVFVMIGDGELQEGQNYEALQATAQQRVGNLVVVVDHNKVQTDKLVSEIVDLGDLETKFRAFGWEVARADGHDLAALERVFDDFRRHEDRPKILIADTIKGKGVSFMEHPSALQAGGGLYQWHAGAPPDEAFERAHAELVERIGQAFGSAGLGALRLEDPPPPDAGPSETLLGEQDQHTEVARKVSGEFVAQAYGAALVEIAPERPEVVVLDADLSADCRVRPFEKSFPDRFIENGIAEQDMVSMAGGLARMGLLPFVNSFASFLTARANEQIYNNASELSKIVYACHYGGLIPAGPGKSHQSLRDIALLGTLPNLAVVQPCNAVETRDVVGWAVRDARENVAIRLAIGPSPRIIELPPEHTLRFGIGAEIAPGTDAALLAYGPVMLHEALLAHERLVRRGVSLRVLNVPWLNRTDGDWLAQALTGVPALFVLEDHGPVGALSDHVLPLLLDRRALPGNRLVRFAVEGYPACGTPAEALRHHRLDGASLARRIEEALGAA
jgi:transketolase